MKSISEKILQNAVFIPAENIYLKSTHVHDFNGHEWIGAYGLKCSLFVDGGNFYIRRVVSDGVHYEDWSLTESDPIDRVVSRLLWRTFGPKGDQTPKWVPLAECTTAHLRAILETQPHVRGQLVERVIRHLLADRK
jgi:hypothetical protein